MNWFKVSITYFLEGLFQASVETKLSSRAESIKDKVYIYVYVQTE